MQAATHRAAAPPGTRRGDGHLDRDLNGLLIGERTFDQRHLKYRNDLAGRTVAVENGAHERTERERIARPPVAGIRPASTRTFRSPAVPARGPGPAPRAPRRPKRPRGAGSVRSCDGALPTTLPVSSSSASSTTARARPSYNLRGELTEATNVAGAYRFERDPLGRIVREEQQHAGRTDWVTSELDPEGDRVRPTTSLGHEEQVQRDALGARTRTLLDSNHDVTHVNDLLGRETARLLPAGGRLETGYDALGRVARRRSLDRTASPTVPLGQPDWVGELPTGVTSDTQYRYRPDGELIEKLDHARGTTTYDYDPVGQLLAFVPQQAKTELFRRDPRGNLTEADPGAPARVYGVGTPRPTETGRWCEDRSLRWRQLEAGGLLAWSCSPSAVMLMG